MRIKRRKPTVLIENCVFRWNPRDGDESGIYIVKDDDRAKVGGMLIISDAVHGGINRNDFVFDETLPPGTIQITPK